MVNVTNALPTSPLHVLRGLYRLLKTPQLSKELVKKGADGGVNVSSHGRRSNVSTAYLMDQYRKASNVALSAAEKERLRKVALECFLLRRDLSSRAELYAMDAGADQILTPKETSRRAAARAGLQLPELYDGSKDTST